MTGGIVFISHFDVKPGKADAFRELFDQAVENLRHDKPGTAAYLGYLAADGSRLTIVHVFPDADAMAAHFEGADDRARAAYELITPAGWEVYGTPHPGSLAELRAAADAAGVDLVVAPDPLGGFLRTGSTLTGP